MKQREITYNNEYYVNLKVALDGGIGDQQLSAAVIVNITIVDVNNKPPVLLEPGTVHVMENTQVSINWSYFSHDFYISPHTHGPYIFLS